MRARFEAFCDLFYRQKRVRAAFESHVVADYVQHSAGMAQGREAAILRVRVGDAVEAIVIDVFRHGSGGIVEHWDVKAELGLQQRQHYFDGLTPRGR